MLGFLRTVREEKPRDVLLAMVYLSLLLDNMLLTVVGKYPYRPHHTPVLCPPHPSLPSPWSSPWSTRGSRPDPPLVLVRPLPSQAGTISSVSREISVARPSILLAGETDHVSV